VNGTVAGGGYELALACDGILIDDRSSTVSLPDAAARCAAGHWGLTRLTDKRKISAISRTCSAAPPGVRADRAKRGS
jgi:enoyl-CoA hydratase/carnithine racemase